VTPTRETKVPQSVNEQPTSLPTSQSAASGMGATMPSVNAIAGSGSVTKLASRSSKPPPPKIRGGFNLTLPKVPQPQNTTTQNAPIQIVGGLSFPQATQPANAITQNEPLPSHFNAYPSDPFGTQSSAPSPQLLASQKKKTHNRLTVKRSAPANEEEQTSPKRRKAVDQYAVLQTGYEQTPQVMGGSTLPAAPAPPQSSNANVNQTQQRLGDLGSLNVLPAPIEDFNAAGFQQQAREFQAYVTLAALDSDLSKSRIHKRRASKEQAAQAATFSPKPSQTLADLPPPEELEDAFEIAFKHGRELDMTFTKNRDRLQNDDEDNLDWLVAPDYDYAEWLQSQEPENHDDLSRLLDDYFEEEKASGEKGHSRNDSGVSMG